MKTNQLLKEFRSKIDSQLYHDYRWIIIEQRHLDLLNSINHNDLELVEGCYNTHAIITRDFEKEGLFDIGRSDNMYNHRELLLKIITDFNKIKLEKIISREDRYVSWTDKVGYPMTRDFNWELDPNYRSYEVISSGDKRPFVNHKYPLEISDLKRYISEDVSNQMAVRIYRWALLNSFRLFRSDIYQGVTPGLYYSRGFLQPWQKWISIS